MAGATGVGVWFFPWRRVHRDWFLVVGLSAVVLVALLVYLTGGARSVFFPFSAFIVVASGAYYRAWPLALLTLVASLGGLCYLA